MRAAAQGRAGDAASIVGVSALGVVGFGWPFVVDPPAGVAHQNDAVWMFAALLPVLLGVVAVDVFRGRADSRTVAVVGVLAGVGALLRLPGGVAGIEPVFFLLVLAGHVLGARIGFVLGALTLFASALLTAGVGPWLPFQMVAAGWVSAGAAAVPRFASERTERAALVAYGLVAGYAYGLVINLWFWPFVAGSDTSVSFVAGAPPWENLARFWAFHVTTSLGFDTVRALTTAALVWGAGSSVLRSLRRATRVAVVHEPRAAEPGLAGSLRREQRHQHVDVV